VDGLPLRFLFPWWPQMFLREPSFATAVRMSALSNATENAILTIPGDRIHTRSPTPLLDLERDPDRIFANNPKFGLGSGLERRSIDAVCC
jgi:hypothetical protein